MRYSLQQEMTISRSATFDSTGLYRYRLRRVWEPDLPRVAFVMLNPSRADGERDDPTIRRCIGFAHAWGFGSLEVVNLFAYRAVTPRELFLAADPIGPENDAYLRSATENSLVVLAWGNHGARSGCADRASSLFPDARCLGVTGQGQPRHPLYVAANVPLRPFPIPRQETPFQETTLRGEPARNARRFSTLSASRRDRDSRDAQA